MSNALRLSEEQLDAYQKRRAPDGTIAATKIPVPLERDVLADVLATLKLHPRVAWAVRMNAGLFKVVDKGGERWIRAAFKGCSDVIGQMRSGAFLAIETKRPGQKPTPEQQIFLDHVRAHGGIAFIAHGIDDVMRELA